MADGAAHTHHAQLYNVQATTLRVKLLVELIHGELIHGELIQGELIQGESWIMNRELLEYEKNEIQ